MKERQLAATWLNEVLSFVEKTLDENHKFDFGTYWSEPKCGTVGCMEGYLLLMYPDKLHKSNPCISSTTRYDVVYLVSDESGNNFTPNLLGIPIDLQLWDYLTQPGGETDEEQNHLYSMATFEEVKSFWIEVIKQVLDGKFDKHLTII